MKYNYYKCPICGHKMKEESYYDSDIHMMIEEHCECLTCDYKEEYTYGNGICGIFGVAFITYGYNHKPNKLELKRYKKKLWSYRKFLLRIHKIKGKYNRI